MRAKPNLTRPVGNGVDCWRIYYSRDTGAVFLVDVWVYDYIQTFKHQPKKLCEALRPVFQQYVDRKARGMLS